MIRIGLGLTQEQMASQLGLSEVSRRSRISEWESGKGEPKRAILLKYTEISGVDIGLLIDDREKIVFKQ